MLRKKKLSSRSPKRLSFWESEKPILIAHRGGDVAGYDRRNTLAAFDAAYKMGYTYFETDVVNTQDGKVIISHGAYTGITARLRGTHKLKVLQGMTYDEIKKKLTVSGEEIILLEELLRRFPSVRFFVDPK